MLEDMKTVPVQLGDEWPASSKSPDTAQLRDRMFHNPRKLEEA